MAEMSSTIRELLVKAAEKYGPQDAIRYKVKQEGKNGKRETVVKAKTYSQLKDDSERFSAAIEKLGEQGAHVAIVGDTSYGWIVTFYGTVNGGNVAVPLDANLPAEDLCELIDRADATVLVFDKARTAMAQMSVEKCPKLKYRITTESAQTAGELPAGTLFFEEVIAGQEPGFPFEPKPEDLSTIMYTSGTTGKSKGVMLTHRNQAENATAQDMGFESGMVLLSVLPIHHAYCLSMDVLKGASLGSVLCINDSLLRVLKNIKLFEPNIILMVPLMIETFAKKLEETDWIPAPLVKAKVFGKQFQTICSGGAYLNPDYIKRFAKYGITIYQGYGMTECAPVISTNSPKEKKDGSIGKCMPNCEVKVVDEELWVKGTSVMQGYYKMPEETAETLVDGWLRTGDLGYVDEDGFLFLTGRKKNLIITPNGENVSPEELENKIGNARLVQEVLVREADGVIEAEVFPDMDYASKKKIKDVEAEIRKIVDDYNETAPLYKRITSVKLRDTEFEKNTTKKIKRF